MWGPGGGTSAACPEFAGIVAIADQYAGGRLGLINPALYRLEAEKAPAIVDVTQGNNTVSFPPRRQDHHGKRLSSQAGLRPRHRASAPSDAARFVPELAAQH